MVCYENVDISVCWEVNEVNNVLVILFDTKLIQVCSSPEGNIEKCINKTIGTGPEWLTNAEKMEIKCLSESVSNKNCNWDCWLMKCIRALEGRVMALFLDYSLLSPKPTPLRITPLLGMLSWECCRSNHLHPQFRNLINPIKNYFRSGLKIL